MSGRSKVIVVMPAYNAGRTIEKTYREIPLDLVDEVRRDTRRPLKVAASDQTCALGAALFGAAASGRIGLAEDQAGDAAVVAERLTDGLDGDGAVEFAWATSWTAFAPAKPPTRPSLMLMMRQAPISNALRASAGDLMDSSRQTAVLISFCNLEWSHMSS